MTLAAALLAAAAAPSAVAPIDFRLAAGRRPLHIVPQCQSQADEIVVCGRRTERTRFDASAPGPAPFERHLGHGVRLSGGGPKGSVGLTLTIPF